MGWLSEDTVVGRLPAKEQVRGPPVQRGGALGGQGGSSGGPSALSLGSVRGLPPARSSSLSSYSSSLYLGFRDLACLIPQSLYHICLVTVAVGQSTLQHSART